MAAGVAAHDFIARVSKAAGARGAAGGEVAVETELKAGVFDLSAGFAELTFKSGVRMVLEAPVRLELLAGDRAKLESGRLVTYVPANARGFSVTTPRAKVIDLGTEFGVGVGESGDTEVQVFRGLVVTEWNGPGGKPVDQQLPAGQAVSIDAQSAPRGIAFQPERFVRHVSDRPGRGPARWAGL